MTNDFSGYTAGDIMGEMASILDSIPHTGEQPSKIILPVKDQYTAEEIAEAKSNEFTFTDYLNKVAGKYTLEPSLLKGNRHAP